jgi:hypothetical protein
MSAARAAVLAALVAMAAMSACQPPPPDLQLAVTVTGAGVDAVAGDGVCEVTPGAGDCTLQAAVDEANAQPRTTITLVGSTSYTSGPLVIGSHVTIRGSAAPLGTMAYVSAGQVSVGTGAYLGLDDVSFSDTAVDLHGALVGQRVGLSSPPPVAGDGVAALTVRAGAIAALTNASVTGINAPAVDNSGLLLLNYSTLVSNHDGVLANAGTAIAQASVIVPHPVSVDPKRACVGAPPTSFGYNGAPDETCSFGAIGDLQGSGFVVGASAYSPEVGDSTIDAIPVGAAGCGVSMVVDVRGPAGPRPVDGDGDGTAMCDRGMREAP